jgi:hypothetical protein
VSEFRVFINRKPGLLLESAIFSFLSIFVRVRSIKSVLGRRNAVLAPSLQGSSKIPRAPNHCSPRSMHQRVQSTIVNEPIFILGEEVVTICGLWVRGVCDRSI